MHFYSGFALFVLKIYNNYEFILYIINIKDNFVNYKYIDNYISNAKNTPKIKIKSLNIKNFLTKIA